VIGNYRGQESEKQNARRPEKEKNILSAWFIFQQKVPG